MLTGKQKRFLRSHANGIKPVFQVGKTGVNDNMIEQIEEALQRRELIKVSVLNNCPQDKHRVADQLTDGASAELVQVIGSNIVLYKESAEHKQLDLP